MAFRIRACVGALLIVCATLAPGRVPARADEPVAKDNGPASTAKAAPRADGMFGLAGQSGLPAYLKADAHLLADDKGLIGGEARTRASMGDHDFILDLVIEIPDGEQEELLAGLGENGRNGNNILNSVCVRMKGAKNRWGPGDVELFVSGQREVPVGKMGTDAGPRCLRIQKKGKTLTFAVCLGYDGTFKPTFSKTLPDLEAAAPFLNKSNSNLFFTGSGRFEAVRLTVDGKPAETGAAAKPPAPEAEGQKEIPLFNLAGDSGLPAYFTASSDALADKRGIRGGQLRTVAKDLIDHDFRLDVQFEFEQAGDHSAIFVGIGENGRDGGRTTNSVIAGSYAPGVDQLSGNTMLLISGQPELAVGRYAGELGPHLLRFEKKGKTLTAAVCVNYKDRFEPSYVRTLPDLPAVAAFLTKTNSSVFIQSNAFVEKVRLWVDGKPAPVGDAGAAAVPNVKPVGPAQAKTPAKDPPLFWLAGAAGIPPAFKATPALLANANGLQMGELRTIAKDLIDKDFTFDVLYQFNSEAEGRAEVIVGLGENAWEGNWLLNSVAARIGSPPNEQNVILVLSKQPESNLGKVGRTAGPHMLRIQKRGRAMTFALCPEFKDAFADPVIYRVIPDVRAAAPFLTAKNAGLFMTGENWTCKAVRLTIDGTPSGPGNDVAASLDRMRGPAGPEHLLKLTRTVPPPFEKPEGATFDAEAGLIVKDAAVHTKTADFISRDFTFDVVYRPSAEQGKDLLMGIGENRWENYRAVDTLLVRLSGAPADGVASLLIPNLPDAPIGKVGKSAGPHLCRLQKVGQTLSIAIWSDVDLTKPLGDPDGARVVPDLKIAAPFLTAKNSRLFFAGNGSVEKLRLIVDGESSDQDLELAVPPRVAEGKPVRQQLVKPADAALAKGKQFSLEAGPKGLTISPAGELAWTPQPDQVGTHEVRVKIAGGKSAYTASSSVEVVSAADAEAVHGDLSKVDALRRLPLAGEHYQLTNGFGGTSMLLLQAADLQRLDPDGFTVRQTLKLPKAYTMIGERADVFVAASDEEKCLDVIDKKTLAVVRSVAMDYPNRFDLALHPEKRISFISVEKPMPAGLRPDILIVEEATGEVREPDDFSGRWLRISPDGKYLYAAYKEAYGQGRPPLVRADRVHASPGQGVSSIDLLIVYDISGTEPREVRVKENMGANGFGLELSPDGKRLAFLSFTGYPFGSNNAASWATDDFTKRPVSYPTKANAATSTKLAFHPILPLAASPTASGVVIFNRETGEAEPGRIAAARTSNSTTVKVLDARFSPDGRNVILECQDSSGQQRYLQKIPLKLSEAEVGQIKAIK